MLSPIDTAAPAAPYNGLPSRTTTPTTPSMDQTPNTVDLRTPRPTTDHIGPEDIRDRDAERREQQESEGFGLGMGSGLGSASGSERSSLDMGPPLSTEKGNWKGKGKAVEADVLEHEDEDEAEFDPSLYQSYQSRLGEIAASERAGDGWSQRDELLQMANTLLPVATHQAPLLQEQIAAQQRTISDLQQQSKLSQQLIATERERHAVERKSWQTETQAIIAAKDAEASAKSGQRKVLDLDVGYHKELEAANKRLEMDNRLMAPRLVDTQRQIDRLVNELRLLRPHVILDSKPLHSTSTEVDVKPDISAKLAVPLPRYMPQLNTSRSARTTMGDARAEHLLLAARTIRTIRKRDTKIGRMTINELRKAGVSGPEGGLGYKEGYGEEALSETDDYSEGEDERRPSVSAKAKVKVQATPATGKIKRGVKRAAPGSSVPQTPSRPRGAAPTFPETTPGGSNFNDLLRAAEMATRPSSPAVTDPTILQSVSATRSTTRVCPDDDAERGSPKRRRGSAWGENEPHKGHAPSSSQGSASALDLLAQASQLDVAKTAPQSSPAQPIASSSRHPPRLTASSPMESSLGAPIDLTPRNGRPHLNQSSSMTDDSLDPSLQTPKGRMRGSSNASEYTPAKYLESGGPSSNNVLTTTPLSSVPPNPQAAAAAASEGGGGGPGAFASPTGRVVPGLGRYWHYTSEMPIKRVRSPYLKWTVEEDELLARAVAIHGEKWDLVSKGVPTRSYHQVRQRWLRKTGAFDKKNQSAPPSQLQNGVSYPNGTRYDPLPNEGAGASQKSASLEEEE
ncbi:hypothetical protein L198_07666 [Cryptococcus wingfieldii CBS 7118]|uniref:Uncharacterized protein n=1 Tax=Cryptococcus wingfieldii CBS 7118 TaxID=1295528 RepID=A0A1E3I537_9TREE|nr:hypothetical protein L198_07666 [Cryptococcus wingfieldii CBS 7118]ODN83770.1 hypothetical protein L198_07666 [Cryptococcus wingfieldii CBS 7118]